MEPSASYKAGTLRYSYVTLNLNSGGLERSRTNNSQLVIITVRIKRAGNFGKENVIRTGCLYHGNISELFQMPARASQNSSKNNTLPMVCETSAWIILERVTHTQ